MFIGIAPRRDEVRKGRPFTDPSGQLLYSVLRSLGIDSENTYATNLVCFPSSGESSDSDKCIDRLTREIQHVQPRIIVFLGAAPTHVFTRRKLGGETGARGAVIWSETFKAYYIPTVSPSAILHGLTDRDATGEPIYDLYRDLRKIPKVLTWPDGFKDRRSNQMISPYADMDYELIKSSDQLQDLLMYLSHLDVPIAIDVETYNPDINLIDVWGDQLLSFAIATQDKCWVIPLEVIEDVKLHPVDWPDNIKWVMHNAQFDSQIIKKNFDVWLEVAEDTMLQSYSLDERGGIHSLKPLAREYLGAGWWEEDRQKGKKRLQEIPREQLYLYNAKDAIYTARLQAIFEEWQRADNVRKVYERILIPAVNAVKEIQYRGVRISKRKHLQFSIEWGQMYMDLEEKLKEMAYEAGWPNRDISLGSPAQISKLLYGVLSLPAPNKIGKSGNPSTDMKTLLELKGQHEIVDELIRYRHTSRYYDTYITGLGKHIKDDGRVHPYVKIHGARTGRWSYGDPPMQTIPQTYEKEGVEEDFQQTREMFIPAKKDYVFIETDYGKGEIWCAQALSGDQQMLADLLGPDYHASIAAFTKNKAFEDVNKEERRTAKTVTFGVMYWEQAYSLGRNIKTSTLEAQMYIDRFFKRNAQYKEWFDETVKEALTNGELVSVTGRKRRLFILDEGVHQLKQAVNYPIQSALGDLTELSYIALHNEFKRRKLEAFVLLQTHDSLLIECHKDIVPLVQEIIHEVMTRVYFDNFPRLPVEMSIGPNWGQTKSVHDCMKHPNCSLDGCTVSCDVRKAV